MLKYLKIRIGVVVLTSILAQIILPYNACCSMSKEIEENSEQKKELNKNIDNLRQKSRIQSQNQKQLENKIAELTKKISDAAAQMKEYKKNNMSDQGEIDGLLAKIAVSENQIANLNGELDKIKQNSQILRDQLLGIFRCHYISSGANIAELFMSSENFEDFLNNIKYTKRFSQHTKNLLDSYYSKIKEMSLIKQNKEREIKEINIKTKKINQHVDNTNKKTMQLDKLFKDYQRDCENLNNLLKQNISESKKIEKARKVLEKENKRLEKIKNKPKEDPTNDILNATKQSQKNTKNEKNNAPIRNKTAGHICPVKGRLERGFAGKHKGIDWSTNHTPSPVYASKAGRVIRAAYGRRGSGYGGFGNAVVIDHGNGETTLYAHLNQILVRIGQNIEQGHKIGFTGTTGNSTGIHLHYEQRMNGVPFSPRF